MNAKDKPDLLQMGMGYDIHVYMIGPTIVIDVTMQLIPINKLKQCNTIENEKYIKIIDGFDFRQCDLEYLIYIYDNL